MTAVCPACSTVPAASSVAESTLSNVTLSVPSVHCASCMTTIEAALNELQGVSNARVNLTLRRVTAFAEIPVEDLVAALKRVGFEAFAFDSNLLGRQTDLIGRNLLIRLGVAGFAMMNVMLLSVAVWSGADAATRDMMHLISAAIALPAAGYSAQPFFVSALKALRARRLNMDVPISLAIVLAALTSLYESLHGGHHAYFDAALSLTFFLLIGRYLEHRTKRTARSAARELAALEVTTAERWNGRKLETVPISELDVGDRIHVSTGSHIPADGTLLSQTAMTNRAFLTGESEPAPHTKGAVLRAGEINIGAPFTITATAVGDDTTLRQIARLVETAENVRNRYTALADRAARIYAPAVHILAAIAFVGWLLATHDPRLALNIAIAVLIITCPCALGLAVPAVSTAAIGRLYEMGFLVKSGVAIERLAETDLIVFDKTGTLTKPEASIDLTQLDADAASAAMALAQVSSHPIAQALRQSLLGVDPAEVTNVQEVAGCGIVAQIDGQEVGLGRSDWLGAPGNGTVLKIGTTFYPLAYRDVLRDGVEQAIAALSEDGYDLNLLSGDTDVKTRDLAKDLGIASFQAALSPQEKQTRLRDMGDQGRHICMIGDGINDAAALATAHSSVAPGSAVDAARNVADVVVVSDSLEKLPELFRTARKAVHLSRQNFGIAAAYNLIAIPIALAGFATPLLAALAMSLSSLTVLFNALRARV